MIPYNEQKDIDKRREEIKNDLSRTVRRALWLY
jgi:hypothetical protein